MFEIDMLNEVHRDKIIWVMQPKVNICGMGTGILRDGIQALFERWKGVYKLGGTRVELLEQQKSLSFSEQRTLTNMTDLKYLDSNQ